MLRFCFGNGNGSGRLARGIDETDWRGLSDVAIFEATLSFVEELISLSTCSSNSEFPGALFSESWLRCFGIFDWILRWFSVGDDCVSLWDVFESKNGL